MRWFSTTSAATAVAACVLFQAPQFSEAAAVNRVFSYHHAEGHKSQHGQHSTHSASQIALPSHMRFASERVSLTSGTGSTVQESETKTHARTHAHAEKAHLHAKARKRARKAKVHAEAEAENMAVPGGGEASAVAIPNSVPDYNGDNAVQTMKLSSPLYGSFAHNYGPVSQSLGLGSGYGGFTANVDPTGFNFQHDATGLDGGAPGWSRTGITGTSFSGAFPARMKVKQVTSVNGFSPAGLTAGVSDTTYTMMGPKSLGPYGVDGTGGPGGSSAQLVGAGVSLAPSPPARGREIAQISSITGPAMLPATAGPGCGGQVSGCSSSLTQLTGRPVQGAGILNGIRMTYDPNLVTQRALAMGGGINTYNTPGVIKQLGVSYPSPAFDRYGSVMPGSQMALQVNTSPLSNLLVATNLRSQQMAANKFRPPPTAAAGGAAGGRAGAATPPV